MDSTVRKQSFLLRLPHSLREQAVHLAHDEGTSLNHFISLAVAEKISRWEAAGQMARENAPLHDRNRPHVVPRYLKMG